MEKLTVKSKHQGKTVFCSEIRGHQVLCELPPKYGGTDSAPIPPKALLAALGNCIGMLVAVTCESRNIPTEGMEITISADMVDEGSRVDNIRAELHFPEELDEKTRKIILATAANCPVGNTLKHGCSIEEVIV